MYGREILNFIHWIKLFINKGRHGKHDVNKIFFIKWLTYKNCER